MKPYVLAAALICLSATVGLCGEGAGSESAKVLHAQSSAGPFTVTATCDETILGLGVRVGSHSPVTIELKNTSDAPQPIFPSAVYVEARSIWTAIRPVHRAGNRYEFGGYGNAEVTPVTATDEKESGTKLLAFRTLAPGEVYKVKYDVSAVLGKYSVECGYDDTNTPAGAQAAWTGRLSCRCEPVRFGLDEASLAHILESLRTSRKDQIAKSYISALANSRVTPVIPELLRILQGKASNVLKDAAAHGIQEFTSDGLGLRYELASTGEDEDFSGAEAWARKYVEAHPEVEHPTDAMLQRMTSDLEREMKPAYAELAAGKMPTMEGLAKEDFLGICEGTFRDLFSSTANWDVKLERRFISVIRPVPAELMERFQGDTVPVMSPYIRDPKYMPDTWEDGRYAPSGGNAMFYYISSITWDGKSRVIVDCGAELDWLATRDYRYTLEKSAGKWVVKKVKVTWMQ